MLQRGRKGAEQLAINVNDAPSRLKTPAGLSAKERALFIELVNSTNVSHFRGSDVSLLVLYVQALLMARKLGRDPKKIVEWEKSARTTAMLATKLRLTPQSRADAKTIGRMQQPDLANAPWRREDGIIGDHHKPEEID